MKFTVETDLGLIKEAISRAYGGKCDSDFVDWLDRGPHGGNVWYVAKDGERIIGVYGVLPGKVCVGGVIVDSGLANNAGIDPAYRKMGVFRTLGLVATENHPADVFVGASNQLAIAGHRQAGWREFGSLVLMSGNLPLGVGRISSANSSPMMYSDNVEESMTKYDFFSVRCYDWVRWRFSKPGSQYRLFADGKGNQVVWKEWTDGRAQILALHGGVRALRRFGGDVDVWAIEGTRFHRELLTHGFDERFKRHLIIKPRRVVDSDAEHVRFELCDNEVF